MSGDLGGGCGFLIVGIALIVGQAVLAFIAATSPNDREFTTPIIICLFLLYPLLIAWGIYLGNHYVKWKADTLSRWETDLANAISELAELNKALSWYDNLPKDERDKFDAAVRWEKKRQKEEQKAREQERRRQESICPQCGKEWALSTSWETVGTNNEFRTELQEEWVQTGRGLTDGFYQKIPIQKQTVVTTEREITKCSYCNYRREGHSRQNRQEIR